MSDAIPYTVFNVPGYTPTSVPSGQQRSYPLFRLHRLVRLKGKDTIREVAVWGTKSNQFTALYCSDDTLVIRYVGPLGEEFLRQLPWFEEPNKRIVSLDFSPDCQWLLCGVADSSLCVIPMDLVTRKRGGESSNAPSTASSNPSTLKYNSGSKGGDSLTKSGVPSLLSRGRIGVLTDATLIPLPRKMVDVAKVLWWRTWDGTDLAVIITHAGNLSFVNVRTHQEECHINLKTAIVNMELLVDPVLSQKYLLFTERNGPTQRLLIETDTSSILAHGATSLADFKMQKLRFTNGSVLGVQQMRGAPVLSVFNASTHKLEVYDASLGKYPLFVYQLVPNFAQLHVTDRILFLAQNDATGGVVSAVSSHFAGTSDTYSLYGEQKNSVLQQIPLPDGETIRGMSRLGPDEPYQGIRLIRRAQFVSPQLGEGELEGLFLWSNRSLYEIRQVTNVGSLFERLLVSGRAIDDAEIVGATAGVDLLNLYESAADKCFSLGQFPRAIQLYDASGAGLPKVIARYLQAGNLEAITVKMRTALLPENIGSLSKSMLAFVSDLLLRCYVTCFLGDRVLPVQQEQPTLAKVLQRALDRAPATPVLQKRTSLDDDLKTFLKKNSHYDIGKAMVLLSSCGLPEHLLLAAHAREIIPKALSIMARGSMFLSPNALRFIQDTVSIDALIAAGEGSLFRSLSAADQMETLLLGFPVIHRYWTLVMSLIPQQDLRTLLRLCELLQPESRSFQALVGAWQSDENATFYPLRAAEGSDFADGYLLSLLYVSFVTDNSKQSEFDSSLRALGARCKPAKILTHCFATQNWSAASSVLDVLGDQRESLDCALQAIQQRVDSDRLSDEDEPVEVLHTLSDYLSRVSSGEEKCYLFLQVCQYWGSRSLKMTAFENYILQRLDTLGLILADCVVRQDLLDQLTSAISFGSFVLLKAGSARLHQITAPPADRRVPDERLWSNIASNLHKDVDRNRLVEIPNIRAVKAKLLQDSPSADALIAFSCGHWYPKREFRESILPQLNRRILALSSFPVSSEVLTSMYLQPKIPLPCPVCTFNQLAAQPGVTSQPELEPWKL